MIQRLLLALGLVVSLSGCFVVEELDNAAALLPDTPAEEKAEPEAAQAPAKPDSDYWKNSRTIAPGGDTGGVVSCNIRGQVQFMKADDCRRRGGRPN